MTEATAISTGLHLRLLCARFAGGSDADGREAAADDDA